MITQASEIAFGARRFRVVTLDGEVIETSGAMSGGGGPKARGKVGTRVRNKVKISNQSGYRDVTLMLRLVTLFHFKMNLFLGCIPSKRG